MGDKEDKVGQADVPAVVVMKDKSISLLQFDGEMSMKEMELKDIDLTLESFKGHITSCVGVTVCKIGILDSPALGNDANEYIIRIDPETTINTDIYQKGEDFTYNS